jgi:probable F420-dependent oxidoreductase
MEYWLSLLMTRETDQLVEIARIAEELGFAGVAMADHLVMPTKIQTKYPYTPNGEVFWPDDTPWPDPWCALSAMAAATDTIRLATHIYLLALRDPFTAARAVGTTAVISGDRVVCGISAGWLEEEYRVLGVDFRSRGERLNEMIDVLRGLWTGQRFEYHGKHFDFEPVRMCPSPGKAIPIWCGGGSRPAIRRAALRCDGWLPLIYSKKKLLPVLEEIKNLRTKAGLAAKPFDVVVGLGERQTPELTHELETAGVTGLMTASPWLFSPKFAKEDTRSIKVKRSALEEYAETTIQGIG